MLIARVASTAGCTAAVILAASLSAAPQGGVVGGSVQGLPTRDQPPPGQRQPPPRTGTGSVTGRVLDGASGMPLARVRVRLTGIALARGGTPPTVLTDAQGRFAFTALPAGPFALNADKSTYVLASYPEPGRTIRGSFRPTMLKEGEAAQVTLRMYHGGVITGRVVDSQGDLVENAEVRAMALPRTRSGRVTMRSGGMTNDIGEFRIARLEPGSYALVVNARGRGPDDPAETQPLPTYYPGVTSLEEAQPITIERGQSVNGLEITLLEGTPSVVSGTVVDAGGQPVTSGAYVNARLVMKDMPGGYFSGGSGGTVKPDGSFRVRLAPGEYDLEVSAAGSSPVSGPPQPGDQQFGWVRLTVPAGPVSDVSIRLGRAGSISGRMVFEGTMALPKNPQQVMIGAMGIESSMCRSGRSQTAADWTFTIEGVFGTCALNPMSAGGWTLKSITRGGENLLDRPLSVRPGQDLRNIVVTFTDRRAALTLNVTDDSGQPTNDYVALAFPVEKERWTTSSRYIQTYSPPPPEMLAYASSQRPQSSALPSVSMSGMPRQIPFPGLPPGDYYIVAVDDIEREATRDPSVLAELATSATKVTIAEGPIVVPLRVKKLM